MAVSYDDWLARAREHLAASLALDALSCFRKAARAKPGARAPIVGIAEALWRLGKPHEAVAAWREAAQRTPNEPRGWQSLADAAAAVGDDVLANEAALRVLAGAPHGRRARFIADTARLVDPSTREEAAAALISLLQQAPHLARSPHLGHALARALAKVGVDDCVALRKLLAADPIDLQTSLVGQVAAFVPLAVLRTIVDRDVAIDDIDDMRVLALAIARGMSGRDADVDGRRMLAQRAAARYCAQCAAFFAADVPPLWPQRTAGDRARIIVVVDGARLDADGIAWSSLESALFAMAPRCEIAIAAFGDAAIVVPRLQASGLVARLSQMPEHPDIESARSLASSDPDLLIDGVGLAKALGPMLAARPARRIVGFAQSPSLVAPLVDGELPGTAAELQQALARLIDLALAMPASPSAADVLGARLAAAVDAHRSRRYDDARPLYDAMLAEQPGHAPVLYLRGVLRREAGDRDGSASDFAAALVGAPHDAKPRAALAQAMLAAHDARGARRVLAERPDAAAADATLLRTLGHAALAERDGAAAVNAFAAAISMDPFDAETHFNHGVALQMMRYLSDAARAYQRALDQNPAMLDVHFNLGVVFDELGETDSAIAALEHVIARAPLRAEVHRALLNVLARHERGAQWMAAFERFEQNCPDALGLVANALEYYQYRGDYAKVHRYVDRLARGEFKPANELDLVDSLEQILYLMLFFDIETDTQASLYATYDKAAQRVYGVPMALPAVRRPGPLRIGYLSADFRDHVMGKMMLEPIRHHDRNRYQLHIYSTSTVEDEVTAAYRANGDAFSVLADLADEAAAASIAQADLDILVDLSSHTRGARPGILARKPARIAITHVASAGALGLSAVDFKLTDALADLPASDHYYVETLLPMQGCVYPLRRMTPATGHAYQRASLGIAEDAVVIGAFVTPLKLSRRTMALWREILDRVPRALLAFSPNIAWIGDTYPAILAAAGIDAARTIVLPQGKDESHNLARYAVVDFVLDPMPFGNVNGTLEPLNMGVPVVTLVGQNHGERTGYSILSHLGETRTIATSGKEYVDIAVRLATDAAFMRDIRESLSARMADSPAADPSIYVRNLEAAYGAALTRCRADGVER